MARIRKWKTNFSKSLCIRKKDVWRSAIRISLVKGKFWNIKKISERKWKFNKIKKWRAQGHWKEKVTWDRCD